MVVFTGCYQKSVMVHSFVVSERSAVIFAIGKNVAKKLKCYKLNFLEKPLQACSKSVKGACLFVNRINPQKIIFRSL